MNINELREKRAKVWENTKSFLESHRSEKGTLSAADENTYNAMMADIDALGKEVQRLEKQRQLIKNFLKQLISLLPINPVLRLSRMKLWRK